MTEPNSERAPEVDRGLSGRGALAVLVVALGVYVFLAVVPQVRGIPEHVGVYGGSLLFACLSMALVGAGAVWEMPPLEEGLLAGALLVAWILADQMASQSEATRLYLAPAGNVLFLLACLFVGKVLSRIVRERGMALPVCIVAALADVFTVFWGPTHQALEKAPKLVTKLSLAIPQAGSAAGPVGAKGIAYVATIGLGDFIFLALFMSLAVRFRFRLAATFWAMLVMALVGILLALANPFGLRGMPLLPYMSVGFVVVNWAEFRLTQQERRDLGIALLILAAMFGIVTLALRM